MTSHFPGLVPLTHKYMTSHFPGLIPLTQIHDLPHPGLIPLTHKYSVRGTKPGKWEVMYLCVRGIKPGKWEVMYLCVRGAKPGKWEVMYLCVRGIKPGKCHSNSVNTGSRLPISSDVKTRKRRNVVGIDMIRNNRIGFVTVLTA
jgi:hypothetical protein